MGSPTGPTTRSTLAHTLAVMLSGYNANVEDVTPGVAHVRIARNQLERVHSIIWDNLTGVDAVLTYDENTLGVFMPGTTPAAGRRTTVSPSPAVARSPLALTGDVMANTTVWKFPLPLGATVFKLHMPGTAPELLTLETQGGHPCLWAWVDPDSDMRQERTFEIAGTGHKLTGTARGWHYEYVSTWQSGGFVFHVFEHVPDAPSCVVAGPVAMPRVDDRQGKELE